MKAALFAVGCMPLLGAAWFVKPTRYHYSHKSKARNYRVGYLCWYFVSFRRQPHAIAINIPKEERAGGHARTGAGIGLERVMFDDTFDGSLMCSPDGKHIVFASGLIAASDRGRTCSWWVE